MPRLATFLTAAVARQLMRNIHCCSTLHTSARLHSHVSSSAAIVQARLSPQSLASLGRFDRLSVLRELALGRRVHSTTERRVALASAQKPLAHNSMKQGSSKQATVPTVSAPPRSKGRKPAAAAVPNAARDAGSAQISNLILEQHHISESAEPPQPEIVVETAGLAKALELTGSAEPKKKRARKGADTVTVSAPATPALERARSRPVGDAGSPQQAKAEAHAALASAIRAMQVAPRKGSKQQQEQGTAVAAEDMPVIPLAERVKGRARRAKTAPLALEAAVRPEEGKALPIGAAEEAAPKKARKRAVKGTAAATATEAEVAPAASGVAVPAKKPRAPRKKPAANGDAAQQTEGTVSLLGWAS